MKQVWKCQACGAKITLYIRPVEPPTHACKKRANRVIELKEESNDNN